MTYLRLFQNSAHAKFITAKGDKKVVIFENIGKYNLIIHISICAVSYIFNDFLFYYYAIKIFLTNDQENIMNLKFLFAKTREFSKQLRKFRDDKFRNNGGTPQRILFILYNRNI